MAEFKNPVGTSNLQGKKKRLKNRTIKFKCKMRDIDNVYSRFLVEERLQFIEVHKDFVGEMRLQVRRERKEIE